MRFVHGRVSLLRLRLKSPFETGHGSFLDKDTVIVHLTTEDGTAGYGEAPVFQLPSYNEECTDTVVPLLLHHVLPAVLGQPLGSCAALEATWAWIRGHMAAKCAVEMAWWHAFALEQAMPLRSVWGGTRPQVEGGISLGIDDDQRLFDAVEDAIHKGYRRVKVKIKPGSDVRRLGLVRERFPEIQLSADANGTYTLANVATLRELDEFELTMLEQPLAVDDIVDHARLHQQIRTPICLDESVRSRDDARRAIDIGAAQIINVKPSRIGGYGQAISTAEDCASRGIPTWVGGMLETGIGKAFNVHLASCAAFTLPGDLSGTDRYFERDVLTDPIVVRSDGLINVPEDTGLGYEIDADAIEALTVEKWTVEA